MWYSDSNQGKCCDQEVVIKAITIENCLGWRISYLRCWKNCNNEFWSIFSEVYFHIKDSDKYVNHTLIAQNIERKKLFILSVQCQYVDIDCAKKRAKTNSYKYYELIKNETWDAERSKELFPS